ncbi:MAG: type VI secretion system baseplate subunit TssE [Polyangiales bacterium]
MVGRGLLSRIASKDPRQSRVENEVESIVAHLRDLLNTRQGEAITVPEFGVIDFTDLVHNFPDAIQLLQRSIRATILQFEPRLKNVVVQHVRDEDVLILKFQISAQVSTRQGRGAVRFETQLRAGGHVTVR